MSTVPVTAPKTPMRQYIPVVRIRKIRPREVMVANYEQSLVQVFVSPPPQSCKVRMVAEDWSVRTEGQAPGRESDVP